MMTKTDELMELMIQEGERLLDEIDFVNLGRAATERYVEDLEKQVSDLGGVKTDLNLARAAIERNAQVIKNLKTAADRRDLQGYVGCALMGFIAGALTACAFLL